MEKPSSSKQSIPTPAEKHAERMKRLRALHTLRVSGVFIKTVIDFDFVCMIYLQNEARTQNHKEVIEEDKRKNLPANWEARQRRAEWIIQDEAARKEADEKVKIIFYT